MPDGWRADPAGAPALLGTPAAGMPKDGARAGNGTLAVALKGAAGLRTGTGGTTVCSFGGLITALGIGADKTRRDLLLARSALGNALIAVRFIILLLGRAAGLASTGGALRPRLDR